MRALEPQHHLKATQPGPDAGSHRPIGTSHPEKAVLQEASWGTPCGLSEYNSEYLQDPPSEHYHCYSYFTKN